MVEGENEGTTLGENSCLGPVCVNFDRLIEQNPRSGPSEPAEVRRLIERSGKAVRARAAFRISPVLDRELKSLFRFFRAGCPRAFVLALRVNGPIPGQPFRCFPSLL